MPPRTPVPAATPTREADRHDELRRTITFGRMWFDLQAAARARCTRNGASGLLREILEAWLYQKPMPITPWSEGRMEPPMYVPDPIPDRIAPPRPTVDRPATVPKAVFRPGRAERPVVPWKVARRDKAKVAA